MLQFYWQHFLGGKKMERCNRFILCGMVGEAGGAMVSHYFTKLGRSKRENGMTYPPCGASEMSS